MKRPYLRVTPGEEPVIHSDIPETVASLSKLTRSTSASLIQRLNPFNRQPPLRFEFVALCAGKDEPVEFYYGADDHLDALEQRLRSIYPSTYEMERVNVDLTKRLLQPVEITKTEFAERIEDGRLYQEFEPSATGQATVSDGGETAVESAPTNSEAGLVQGDGGTTTVLDEIDLATHRALEKDEALTRLDRPVETRDGNVYARPPLEEIDPYGVEWWGTAARRKDWMTTLTGFTEVLSQSRRPIDERSNQSRLPLEPLINEIANAEQPLAFQVLFQRRADWSRDARRRAGELLDGTDTVIQKFLRLESPGSERRSGSRSRSSRTTGQTSHSPAPRRTRGRSGEGPVRPTGDEDASRYDLVRSNTPKRTFSVNLRLLALAGAEDEPEDLDAHLNPLRSVFDLLDGKYYEIDGRRLRSMGYLPGAGERHARGILDGFTSRSVTTGGKRLAITNRSESRPDLVLNGNELANFIVIPPSSGVPVQQHPEEKVNESSLDKTAVTRPDSEDVTRSPELESQPLGSENGGNPFSMAPDKVVHRDVQVNQLSEILEPITQDEQSDTVLVTGPPGSGKTCATKFVIGQIRQDHPALDAVYINCWEDHSRFQVLYQILDAIDSTVDIHRQSTPRDILLDRLREYDEGPCLVVLDEVDQLEDKNLLYELTNLPPFSLLHIVNREEDLLDGLDQRLVSRLRGCERVRFDQYSDAQILDILREQEEMKAEFEEAGLELIAEASDGDARIACTTLRLAARRLDEVDEGVNTRQIVEEVLPDARHEIMPIDVEDLTDHHQSLLRVIEEAGRIAPGDLYEKYSTRVDEPKSERTIRDYLTKLERNDLISAEGSTRNRTYRSRLHRQP